MSRSLSDQFDALRRELRLAAVLRGVIWTVIALVGALLVVIGLDYVVQSEHAWWRWTITLLGLAPAVLAGALFVVRPLSARFGPLEVAQWLERADPRWKGELASAAAFGSPEAGFGSSELQRKTLEQATQRLAASPVRLVRWPGVWRAGLIGIGLLLVGGFVGFLAPEVTRTALGRVARPWADSPWPRRVELRLVLESGAPLPDPLRISEDEPFRFFVKNTRGPLPDDLTLLIDRPGVPGQRREIPTADQAPSALGEGPVGVATLLASDGPLQFRVVGGDDRSMSPLTAKVVAPPSLHDFIVTVNPPAYLQAGSTTGPPGATRVRGVVGSQVTIHAQANKPLSEVDLFVGDEPAPEPRILEGGREIVASFKLTSGRPSSYWFRLRDRSGFENRRPPRFEISAKIDAAPEVSLHEPKVDLTATPQARLAIDLEASDDHGLTAVQLRFGPGDRLPDAKSADSRGTSETLSVMSSSHPLRHVSRRLEWALAGLDLEVGDQVTIRAEGRDAYNLGPPHVGMSAPRTITIVSAETKRRELLASQAVLLRELTEAHEATVQLRQASGALAVEVAASEQIQADHHDRISRAELKLQRIREDLVGTEGSSETATRRILAQLSANQIDAEALRRRLERIAGSLASLRETFLPSAAGHLTEARKSSQRERAAQSLRAAGEDLAKVEQALAKVVENLGAWQRRRDVLGEIDELAAAQQKLVEETSSVARQTLGRRTEQLTPAQMGHLEELALRQTNLSDRIDRLSQRLRSANPLNPSPSKGNEEDGKPSATESSDSQTPHEEASTGRDRQRHEVLARLESSGMAMTARAAGESIRENRLGQAHRLQSEILAHFQNLKELLQTSAPSGEQAPSVQQLQDELTKLSARQTELLETLVKRGQKESPPSSGQRQEFQSNQSQLRARTREAAQQARQAEAKQAAGALMRATGQMKQALERLRKHQDRQGREALTQALQELRQARKHLAKKAGSGADPLADAMEQSLAARFQSFAKRQASVNKEITRLQQVKAEAGALTRGQLLTLQGTAEVQSGLAVDVNQARESLAEAVVIQFTLTRALAGMKTIAQRLEERDLGRQTQRHAAEVLARLQEIAKAFESVSSSKNKQEQNGRSSAQKARRPRRSEGVPDIVALELLRLRQLELQRRTREIEQRRQGESPGPEITTEIEAIARETAALAQMAATILSQQSATE